VLGFTPTLGQSGVATTFLYVFKHGKDGDKWVDKFWNNTQTLFFNYVPQIMQPK